MAAYNKDIPPPAYATGVYPPPIDQFGSPSVNLYVPPPVNQFASSSQIHYIRDWLIWSILNILFGWFLGGIVPLIFSIMCRKRKRQNDFHGARSMSTLALVSNIIVTLAGIAGWIALIVWIVLSVRTVNNIINTSST